MKRSLLVLALFSSACRPAENTRGEAGPALPRPHLPDPAATLDVIAFGSCLQQDGNHAILEEIRRAEPDVFMFIGDNVYADPTHPRDLERAFAKLGRSPAFQALEREIPLLAIWDDHDYGPNDSGASNPIKAEVKSIMLDFFGVPRDAPRRQHPGNYDTAVYGREGRRVQIVLLDTRWFRDPLLPAPGGRRYLPHPEPGPTLLGEAQWQWLERVLTEPAELRILVSSIQVIANEHGFEGWGLFPHERARLFALLGRERSARIVIASGDRHRGELSCVSAPELAHPIYDLTASSLNKPFGGNTEDNRHRKGELVADANYGRIAVDWDAGTLRLELLTTGDRIVVSNTVSLRRDAANDTEACVRLE